MVDIHTALVRENGFGRFQNDVVINGHSLIADEPASFGGDDQGPSPFEFLAAGLGACTSMTLRMYAERKNLDVVRISCLVSHTKRPLDPPVNGRAEVDVFTRTITIEGNFGDETQQRMLDIANRCPVHRTLTASSIVETVLA
jgi:putative redox protein